MDDAFERAVDQERQQRRRRRHRQARAGFRVHAIVYGAVNVVLLLIWGSIWLQGGTAFPWVIYPVLGWGVGLVAHYLAIRPAFASRAEHREERA